MGLLRRGALLSALALGLVTTGGASAQSVAPAPAAPATAAPAPVVPAAPPAVTTPAAPPAAATPTPPPALTPPAPADAGPTAAPPADKGAPDTSISQAMELQPRPVVQVSGQATWEEGFKALNGSFDKLLDALKKVNVPATGRPLAVFSEVDDAGFKFTAMVPVEKAPDDKAGLPADVSFGMAPGGKIMKFQHRSAYDDIDSTYEAITAYLDEKGLEAKNMFAEEYINRVKTPDDSSLEVDIYVFLK